MRLMRIVESVADAIDQLGGGQEPGRLDDAVPGVEPHRLDGIEAGALARQRALDAKDAGASLLDLAVMGADPGSDLGADVPGGVVSDQQQGRLTVGLESAWSRPQHQARNWVVIALTGRPSTKRGQTCSCQRSRGAADRTSRPRSHALRWNCTSSKMAARTYVPESSR